MAAGFVKAAVSTNAERFPDPVSHGSDYSFLVSEFSIPQAFLLL